ncbi:hypothetical protein RHD99_13340 [Buttiauxella selenatireducens]|uniref:Uncharacterized protein n=1 Tax=Buttiauxella selenatireducens TaxID=3073902 RepID=A0ABY9S7R1_9ENTR|nr:hypothetical protein [Buttiauxella sp. R73]WMY72471.1 hypothetical protein RHD99_13340 [Buttiauxella sp. R73]
MDSSKWSSIVDNLVSKPTWIMDGNYSGTLAIRLVPADTVIHLDYPAWLCVWRVRRRTMMGLSGNGGNELTPGCEERFDLAFLSFVFNYRKNIESVISLKWLNLRGNYSDSPHHQH